MEIAGRVGRLEFDRAVRDARSEGSNAVIAAYRAAIAATDRWAGEAMSAGAPVPATSAGAALLPATSAGAVRVAIPHPDPDRASGPVRAPAELLPASRWWVENVELEPQRGFGQVKERDAFVCQNPECGRRSLRNHAHHKHERQAGGPDTPENGATLCPVCHLRGVHGGRLKVDDIHVEGREAYLWAWPDGRRVVAFLGR
jgi:hypothetical protein